MSAIATAGEVICYQREYCHSINIRLIGQEVFSRQIPENRPLSLKAYTAYSLQHCIALQCMHLKVMTVNCLQQQVYLRI
jgi:hypothetical protein